VLPQDEGPLKFLVDISCSELTGEDEDGDPQRGFKLDFTFVENPYFSNTCVLVVVFMCGGLGCWEGRCGCLAWESGPAPGSLVRVWKQVDACAPPVRAVWCARHRTRTAPAHCSRPGGCSGGGKARFGAGAGSGADERGSGRRMERSRG